VSFTGSQLSTAQLKALAESHIRLYGNMANRGGPGIRVGECVHYLSIWESIARKGFVWSDLAPEERNEVEDACFCGDYDKLLEASHD
jgi:hypothetical protein